MKRNTPSSKKSNSSPTKTPAKKGSGKDPKKKDTVNTEVDAPDEVSDNDIKIQDDDLSDYELGVLRQQRKDVARKSARISTGKKAPKKLVKKDSKIDVGLPAEEKATPPPATPASSALTTPKARQIVITPSTPSPIKKPSGNKQSAHAGTKRSKDEANITPNNSLWSAKAKSRKVVQDDDDDVDQGFAVDDTSAIDNAEDNDEIDGASANDEDVHVNSKTEVRDVDGSNDNDNADDTDNAGDNDEEVEDEDDAQEEEEGDGDDVASEDAQDVLRAEAF